METIITPQPISITITGAVNVTVNNSSFEYLEHLIRFYNNDQIEILNPAAPNFLKVNWNLYSSATLKNWIAENTFPVGSIEIFIKPGAQDEFEIFNENPLVISKSGNGVEWEDTTFLIRIKRGTPGQFV